LGHLPGVLILISINYYFGNNQVIRSNTTVVRGKRYHGGLYRGFLRNTLQFRWLNHATRYRSICTWVKKENCVGLMILRNLITVRTI